MIEKLHMMVTVHQTQPTIQLLLTTNEYAGALDLIRTTQEVLHQELMGIVCFRFIVYSQILTWCSVLSVRWQLKNARLKECLFKISLNLVNYSGCPEQTNPFTYKCIKSSMALNKKKYQNIMSLFHEKRAKNVYFGVFWAFYLLIHDTPSKKNQKCL